MAEGAISDREKAIVRLGNKPTLNFYELAVGISKLHEEQSSSISDLPMKTGISRRRIYYLLDVGNLIRARGLSKVVAEEIGWTKLQIITRQVLTKGGASDPEFEHYLAVAKTTKARDLKAVIDGIVVTPTRAVTFHLNYRQRQRLYEALVDYGAAPTFRGLIAKEQAIMEIVDVVIGKDLYNTGE